MKKLRIISALICISLLLSITPPLAYATNAVSSPPSSVSRIITGNNNAIYTYTDSSQSYCIYLDTISGNGSFAIIYTDDPDNMCEYLFSVSPDKIDPSSHAFWTLHASKCFSKSQNWSTTFIPDALISTSSQNGNNTRATADETYFTNWLHNKHGLPYADRIIGYPMKQSQLFVMYQTLSYDVSKAQSHNLNTDMSIAGFILSVLGLVVTDALINAIIQLFDGALSIIPAGSRLDQYELSAYYRKYVIAQGGNIIHASATKIIKYVGFARVSTNYRSVDEGGAKFYYYPSEELFEDNSVFMDAAWEHFCNP